VNEPESKAIEEFSDGGAFAVVLNGNAVDRRRHPIDGAQDIEFVAFGID
jgi:hypothetical protein